MIVWFFLGGAALVFFVAIAIYNGLVGKKNAVEEAFSGIDVQLKKRYDLIPNLVDSAKAYMQHEKSLLENIVSLRNRAMEAPAGSAQSIQANAEISTALRGLSVAVENYPQLRSVESFNLLQRSLNEVEEQLSAARRTYNSAVVDYNNALEQIPSSFFASAMGYQRKAVFEAAQAERANVSVGKLFQ
jgi:LemA protein